MYAPENCYTPSTLSDSEQSDALGSQYLRLRWDGAGVIQDGIARASFGQRIERTGSSELDGVFGSWRWDGKRLVAEVDRFGIFPLHFYTRDGEIGVSNSIVTLLEMGAPTSLDWEALAVLFHWNGLVGDDTPFLAIKTLPPGGILEWQDGRTQMKAPDLRVSQSSMTRESAMDGFIELTAQALEDRSGTATLLPLSGGRDSRHLLLRLVESRAPPDLCVTVGSLEPGCVGDAQVARELTRRTGVPHRVLERPPCRVQAEAEKNLAIGFTSFMHSWYLSVLRAGAEAGSRTVYDGLQLLPFGHTGWSDERRLGLLGAGRYQELAGEWIFSGLDAARAWLAVLPQQYHVKVHADVAVNRLARELERFGEWPNPLGAFLVFNRTRRAIGNQLYSFWPRHVSVHCPFMDHRVFGHIMSLPPSLTMDSDFHTDAIHRAFPRYADIPFSDWIPRERSNWRDMSSARRLLWMMIRDGGGPLLRMRYIMPRVLRASMDPRYAQSVGWLANMAVYAMQLGRYLESIDAGSC
jgi:asparagine synthase (glutamine-hydrolysing)